MTIAQAPALPTGLGAEGKVFCYSGDSAWTDTLIDAARGRSVRLRMLQVREAVPRAYVALGIAVVPCARSAQNTSSSPI